MKNFSERDSKNFARNFLSVTEKSSKTRNDFTRLWR